jgi:riboflavin biosynthesis pyrimidine reductase
MRRLLPDPAEDLSVADAYGAALGQRSDAPWVSLCMVASIDGSTVVDGTSAKLSSPTDAAVLWRLRELADVILVGAGTVRDEGYGVPRKPGQRIGVVTHSGRLDFAGDLFTSGAGFVVTSESGASNLPDGIDVVRSGVATVDLAGALLRLDQVTGTADVVQVEGGAALNGAMFDADLIDEIDLTTSPATVGGGGPGLASGSAPHSHRFDLVQVAIDDESFVYTRWLRRRD